MSEIMKGDFIRKKRKEKGWSQQELAEIIDVSRETISNWENDKGEIKRDHRKKLAEAFGVSEISIIYGKDDTGLDNTIKEWLSRELETLDAIEDRSIVSIDIAASAFGMALIAIAFALFAAFNHSGLVSVFCLALLVFGVVFIIIGRQVVRRLEQKKVERRAARKTENKSKE